MRIFIKHITAPGTFVMFFLLTVFYCSMAAAEDKGVIKGKVVDVKGQAVEGAKIFVYATSDVKRTADFISAATDRDGLYHMVLPSGKYWLVARTKKSEDFGPLMPGDRHSGYPAEIEVAPGRDIDMDFSVADIKEAIKMKSADREGPLKVTGRIIDENGAPVTPAYAFAHRTEIVAGIPDYPSAWVDREGRYTLYVPRGKYFIGSAVSFPAGMNYSINQETTIDQDRPETDIVRKSAESR